MVSYLLFLIFVIVGFVAHGDFLFSDLSLELAVHRDLHSTGGLLLLLENVPHVVEQ